MEVAFLLFVVASVIFRIYKPAHQHGVKALQAIKLYEETVNTTKSLQNVTYVVNETTSLIFNLVSKTWKL